ncbi:MAG TPA: flagellar basal-body rod protein FlgF [Solirubrobacteraceae bacterium]|jgi:flagellar basal-body rod protein FlgG
MLEGLYSAAAGMSAQQEQLDTIANDLANVSTTGYKSERVGFQDLLYNQVKQAGTSTTSGAGAVASVIGRDGAQGSLQQTGRPLDLAIQGEGFFQVKLPSGQLALTRNGALSVDGQGHLVTADGSLLDPPITLPAKVSAAEVSVAADGTVSAGATKLGQIALVNVPAPDKLLANGHGGFTVTAASGAAKAVAHPQLMQGALEGSNVDMGAEMVTMMSTQRNYSLASSAIKTQDQMLAIANQLRA